MAYLATGRMIAMAEKFSRLRVHVHGQENIPRDRGVIFVVNHFTRIETLLLPYHIHLLTHHPVWSLADASFFDGPLSGLLDMMGAISTKSPDRDQVVVKTLLTGEANWIIFPEGRMVKDKRHFRRRFLLPSRGTRPHSGAATLTLRTEFYRQRLSLLTSSDPAEADRILQRFGIEDPGPVLSGKCWIVPVNLTYYPLRAKENILGTLANVYLKGASPRLKEEMLTEGSMLFSGVDIDIRFGEPLDPSLSLLKPPISRDIGSRGGLGFDDPLPSLPDLRREAHRLMESFMSSIYRLTTVNHDHLFASLLRAYPLASIDEDDLRRRVFLLASECLAKSRVHCHTSLKTGQLALLTDDRYHKYRDFLLLALETGVVTRKEGVLHKDRSKFSAPFDLQRVRIENPLGVIANEVMPLSALQREVHLMDWLPAFVVRARVAALLERQALAEFEADYREFYRDGETKERRVGAPVLLRGRSRKVGVVLVHGFLAAPAEVAELAHYLNEKGCYVYQVRLKGHGTSPDDLALRSGADWVESVDLGVALMKALCDRVVLGGFSFGAGVALDCASRVPGIAGVFAVCPPLRLMDISSRFAPAITVWNRLMDAFSYQWAKKEFVETVPERPHINYARLPVSGVLALGRFMKDLEGKLHGIETPVLVVQAAGDPVVDPRGSRRLFELLGSRQKGYRLFPFERHGILAGPGSGEVFVSIDRFLEGVMGGAPLFEGEGGELPG
ncbi:alpha/beta fold hydrolase [Geomonas sp. Red32]|uniref:alpha/beta fold hydrolase n=1 Tax=Geomonas sp. Red32 TaxID=2912856 RepID=UPI00202CB1C4|nr:alpha/beta fold hydrolase [Geomonas sp. Red32]MCM0081974.1 alpha/beta fold hydrolase [Geomonas sp. Red32]